MVYIPHSIKKQCEYVTMCVCVGPHAHIHAYIHTYNVANTVMLACLVVWLMAMSLDCVVGTRRV